MESTSFEDSELQNDTMDEEISVETIVCSSCGMNVSTGKLCPVCGNVHDLETDERFKMEESKSNSIETDHPLNLEQIIDTLEGVEEPSSVEVTTDEIEVEPEKAVIVSKETESQDSIFSRFRKYVGFRGDTNSSLKEDNEGQIGQGFSERSLVKKLEGSVPKNIEKIEGNAALRGVDSFDAENFAKIEIQGKYENLMRRINTEPIINQFSFQRPSIEVNPVLYDVQEKLIKSVSLELWLVDLLQRGEVDGEQFTKMFRGYAKQTGRFMKKRNRLLGLSQELSSLEMELKKARVYLAELEMKRSLRVISEEEYHVKVPVYNWDIEKYGREMVKKKNEVEFLQNLTKILPQEEFLKLKGLAEKCHKNLENIEFPANIDSEVLTEVENSLNNILTHLR